MKQAILYLSDKSTKWIVDNFQQLSLAGKDNTDVIFLYHMRNEVLPESIQALKHYTFTDAILYNSGYKPIENSLVPGSNHYPLLQFFLENPEYDYYWVIEDDVVFNGDWNYFFDSFKQQPADFVSSYIKKFDECPDWYWWFTLNAGNEILSERIRSFNPVYRMSNKALNLLNIELKEDWTGHHEVVIPTFVYNRGLSLLDMGDAGSFVKDSFFCFYNSDTMSHLPVEPGCNDNLLYHPVKEKKVIDLANLRKYCVLSAVGQKSLHREWIQEEVNFDLHLIIYDNSYNKFYNDTNYISYQKGYKFKLVHDYLQKHPEYLEHYECFFVPDDDISIDPVNISKLFGIMEEYQLEIAQPALSDSYYTYEHTIKQKGVILRQTNFVEMMAPCFSRNALKKVLFTFNENISGWGIEFHWSKLIGFSGVEMAVVDDVYCVHTRPIQSNNSRNYEELIAYLYKYNLNKDIVETGSVSMCNNVNTGWIPVVVDKKEQKQIINHLERIAHQLSSTIGRIASVGVSEGRIGISLFFFNYYRFCGKRKYYDIAMAILESIYDSIGNIAADFSFSSGLSGVSSTIEYLVQEGFVHEDTDEILEDICIALNECEIYSFSKNKLQTDSSKVLFNHELNIKEIIGYGMHYLNRLKNPNHNPNKNAGHLIERFILIKLVDLLDYHISNSHTNSSDLTPEIQNEDSVINNPESLIEITRFLIQTQDTELNFSRLDSILEKYMSALYSLISSINERDLYQELIIADTLYYFGYISKNTIRKQDAINLALKTLNWVEKGISNLVEIKDMQVAYLYNQFYQRSLNNEFKKASVDWMNYCLSGQIGSKQGSKGIIEKLSAFDDLGFQSGLANVGLILIASVADFNTNWDKLTETSYFLNPCTKYAFVMSKSEKSLL